MLDGRGKVGRFVEAATLAGLRENFVTVVTVAGRKIALARSAAGVRAFDGTCTHAKYNFGTSRLVGGTDIECPFHGARFNAETGAVTKGPAKLPLPCIEVHVEGESVRVLVDWPEAA